MTGWTFEELDRQPREEVAGLLIYTNKRGAIEAERQRIATTRNQ
jgi:hypothetical protein